MHFTRLAVLAAALNLAIGAPVLPKKPRDLVANDMAKRALEPLPTTNISKRSAYEYNDTPHPSLDEKRKRNAVAAAHEYRDTPRPSMEEKRKAVAAAYEYKDTPRPSLEEKRSPYEYNDTPHPNLDEKREAAAAAYEYKDTPLPGLEERR